MHSESHSFLFLKYSHLFFCSLLLVLSIALIVTAAAFRNAFVSYNDFLYNYNIVLTNCIFFGCTFVVLISLWGCYAAVVKNRTFMIIYIVLLLLAFLLKFVILALYVSSLKYRLSQSIEDNFDVHIKNYEVYPEAVDYLQSNLKCCGKIEYSSYEWYDAIGYIPSSCCPERYPETNSTECRIPTDIFTINNEGCLIKLQNMPEFSMTVITWLLTLLLITEVISLVLSTYMWMFRIELQNEVNMETRNIQRIIAWQRDVKLASISPHV